MSKVRNFLSVAKAIANFSKDPVTQVGAVLVSANNRIISTGYNGFINADPKDKLVEKMYTDRSWRIKNTVHAEMNCIINNKSYHTQNTSMYVYGRHPCFECGKHLAQSGYIKAIYVMSPEDDPYQPSQELMDLYGISDIHYEWHNIMYGVNDLYRLYEKFGWVNVPVGGNLSENISLSELLKFRSTLLTEEYSEYMDAVRAKVGGFLVGGYVNEFRDSTEAEDVIDSLIDIVVIAFGTLMMLGVDHNKAFSVVIASLKNKEVGKSDRVDGLNFDMIKTPAFKSPSHIDNLGNLFK